MAEALPGEGLRPHVKADKSTPLATMQATAGHGNDTAGGAGPYRVGKRVRIIPAHAGPTEAYHQTMHLAGGDEVPDSWPVDQRSW